MNATIPALALANYHAGDADLAAALLMVARQAAVPGMVATLDRRSFAMVPDALSDALAERLAVVGFTLFGMASRDGSWIRHALPSPVASEGMRLLDVVERSMRSVPVGYKMAVAVVLAGGGSTITGASNALATVAYHWAQWACGGRAVSVVCEYLCEACDGRGDRPHKARKGKRVTCEACKGGSVMVGGES